MLILFLAIVLSIIFSIFATQNTGLVTLYFYNFSLPNIPIYLVILASVLSAFGISLFIQLIKNLSSGMTISSQQGRIKSLKRELAEVTKELHKMELENAKFKAESGEPEDENSI
jgi:uncharacterized integral membrane protein